MDRTTGKKNDSGESTSRFYIDLDLAFRFFNARLFAGKLPTCLITLQRKRGTGGFFAANRFEPRDQREPLHEIALNPTQFARGEKYALSILAHEMCHSWQLEYGEPKRRPKSNKGVRGYHDREWAEQMISIGLMPSETGEPGGRPNGYRMNHYIMEGQLFDHVCDELLAMGSIVRYIERNVDDPVMRERKRASKTRYSCENCDLTVWGKPDIRVRCEACDVTMIAG